MGTLVIAAAGAVIVLYASRHGLGFGGDSGAYFGIASNLRHGRGLTLPYDLATDRFSPFQAWSFHGAVPSTQHPPGYPLAITLFTPPGFALGAGARVLGVVLTVLNLTLCARIAVRLLPIRRAWASLLVPVALIAVAGKTIGFLMWHATFGTEALFFALMLSAVLLALRQLSHPSTRQLVALTASCAFALPTRYAGICLVPLVAVVAFRTADTATMKRRFVVSGACAGVAMIPWAMFLFYGKALDTSGVGSGLRQFVYHPPHGAEREIGGVVLAWFVSPHASTALRVMLVSVIGVVLCLGLFRLMRLSRQTSRPVLLLACVSVSYLAVVVFSRTFIDAGIPLDDRILAPIMPFALMVFVAAAVHGTDGLRGRSAAIVVCVGALVFVVPRWDDQRAIVRIYARTHTGRAFPELEELRRAPVGTLIVSSAADVITSELQRPAIMTAKRTIEVIAQPNRCFERDVSENADLLNYYGGYIWFSNGSLLYGNTVAPDVLARRTTATEVARSDFGALYRVAKKPNATRPMHLPC